VARADDVAVLKGLFEIQDVAESEAPDEEAIDELGANVHDGPPQERMHGDEAAEVDDVLGEGMGAVGLGAAIDAHGAVHALGLALARLEEIAEYLDEARALLGEVHGADAEGDPAEPGELHGAGDELGEGREPLLRRRRAR